MDSDQIGFRPDRNRAATRAAAAGTRSDVRISGVGAAAIHVTSMHVMSIRVTRARMRSQETAHAP
jgi:hypothetical protein